MSIHHWPSSERPREKLLQLGADALSDAELLAIFLRTGVRGKNAVDLARDLIHQFGSLKKIFELPEREFCALVGLGRVKYVTFQAILVLAQRYLYEEMAQRIVLKSDRAVREFVLSKLSNKSYEVFACLFFDAKLRVLQFTELFRGSVDRSAIYPREVVKAALDCNASSVILVHNHPSGDPTPSEQDVEVTKRLTRALQSVDIRVLDHLIVGAGKTTSVLLKNL